MPSGKSYGNLASASGSAHIATIGSANSPLAQFLYPFMWRNVVFIFDDFCGGESQESGIQDFIESRWQDENSSGGTAFGIPGTQVAGGVTKATTGATTGNTTALWGMRTWKGDQNCGMEIRWQMTSDVDDCVFETGFSDELDSEKVTAINNIDTPTTVTNADDVALVAMDTNATLKTMAFITDGSTASMNATKTELGTRTPSNSTYQSVRIQLEQVSSAVARSYCYILGANNDLQETAQHGNATASQIKGSVLMEPRFLMEAGQSSGAIISLIDYWAVWQDR